MDGVDISKRDHTGGKAKILYEKILSGGAVPVKEKSKLLQCIEV
jgi:hypothetical protein